MPGASTPATSLALDGIVVKCAGLGPEEAEVGREVGCTEYGGDPVGVGLPEEGVDGECAGEPDAGARNAGGEDFFEDGDAALGEKVGDLDDEEKGELGAEDDGGEG